MPLVQVISTHRLSSYKKSFNCSSDEEALKYYYWNQALSSEIYVLLHNIEICLRNRIHTALSLYVSQLNKESSSENYNWYDFFDFEIPSKENHKVLIIGETGQTIESSKKKLSKKRMDITPQNVISNLDFGAWRHILNISHCNNLTHTKNRVVIDWSKINPQIFVHYKDIGNKNKRLFLMDRLREIGLLRNRVAHLEPVWKYKQREIGGNIIREPSTVLEIFGNLRQEIAVTVKFLGWLCNETHDFYLKTASYRNLQELIQYRTIADFNL